MSPKKLRSLSLTNPIFLAGKAGAAAALALVLVNALGIPDKVTASFVAVLCCSPGALLGIRTSVGQFLGSVLGGVFGTLSLLVLLPQPLGIATAVALAIVSSHSLGFYKASTAASFTALFVQIVTFGSPGQTLGYRLAAVIVAAFSAFLINLSVSAFFYESLFRKRKKKINQRLTLLLSELSTRSTSELRALFVAYSQIEAELSQALIELEWRKNEKTMASLLAIQKESQWQAYLIHLILDLEYVKAGQEDAWQAFGVWIGKTDTPVPIFTDRAHVTFDRIVEHLAIQK